MLLRVLVAAIAVSSVAINAIPLHGVKLEAEAADLSIREFPAMIEFEESVPVEFDLDLDEPTPAAAPVAPAAAPAAPARPPINFDFDSLDATPLGKLKVMSLPDPKNLRNGLYKTASPVAASDPVDIPQVYSQPNFTASDDVPFTVAQPIHINVTSPHGVKNETEDFIKFDKAEEGGPLGKIKTVPHADGAKPAPNVISKVQETMGPIVIASPHAAPVVPTNTIPSFLQLNTAPMAAPATTQQASYPPNPAVPHPAAPVHTMDPFYVPVNRPAETPYHSTLLDPVQIRADPHGVQLYAAASGQGPLNKLAAHLRNYEADDSFVEMGGRVWRAEPRVPRARYVPQARYAQRYAQPEPRYAQAQAQVQMQAHEMAAAMFDDWVHQNY